MIIAALADLHTKISEPDSCREIFKEVSGKADILLLGGDLTDHGEPSEAKVLAAQLKDCSIPVLAVLGNHDFESDQIEEVTKIIESERVQVLDGDWVVKDGVGFAGAKGFGGGFAPHHLPPWGEPAIKVFATDDIGETLKLERALSHLETKIKIVLLHYAPITETIEGESLEVYPFLGSSRLVEPIDNLGATIVFHGHSHHGKFQGKTPKGVPVHNVALDVLRHLSPPKSFYLYEVKNQPKM
ncbi:metallophosphoesterase [Patescibacteria group bacterium]|nr:metallophosphoesterase [Patescibacteria group bacterium]